MMKKWWIVALVITLALSLTSCSKKRDGLVAGEGQGFGFGYCDGELGQFDVYVIPVNGNPGRYELSIIPVQVRAGDIVRIAIANSSLAYREMVSQVVVNPDVEIQAGFVNFSDFQFYDILAIRPAEPGTNFLDGSSNVDAICELPLPLDSLGNPL